MEKKELLFFVVVLALVYLIFNVTISFKAEASSTMEQGILQTIKYDNTIDVAEEAKEKESVQRIIDAGRRSALGAIKDKWNELMLMVQNSKDQELHATIELKPESLDSSETTLKVFVSTSMSVSLLKSYGEMARKYGAILVLNGLPEESWRKLSDLIFEINKHNGDNIEVQIDDTAFDEFGITRVPSFVLVREENLFEDSKEKEPIFDKISGNIGIRRALEEFAEKGQLQNEATAILNKAEGK